VFNNSIYSEKQADEPVVETSEDEEVSTKVESGAAETIIDEPSAQEIQATEGKSVKLINPKGGETLCLEDQLFIQWEHTNLSVVGLYLKRGGISSKLGVFEADANDTGVKGEGVAVWSVGEMVGGMLGPASVNEIRIFEVGNGDIDDISGVFSIIDCRG